MYPCISFWDFKENSVCQRCPVRILQLARNPDQNSDEFEHGQAGKRDTIGPAIQPGLLFICNPILNFSSVTYLEHDLRMMLTDMKTVLVLYSHSALIYSE
jgi:hypothetical protein